MCIPQIQQGCLPRQVIHICIIFFNLNFIFILWILGYGILVQDNAPQHKSSYTSQVLRSWGIKVMDWPPESPDLNPIELVWGNMKNSIRYFWIFQNWILFEMLVNLRRNKNVRTLDELRDEVIKYWKSLTSEICSNYVRGIQKKMNRVVEQRGRNIYEGK